MAPSIEPDVENGEVELVKSEDKEYGARNSDNMSYKTSEGVETMLYDEAPPTCWTRFWGEWKLKFFELSETDEAVVDVHASFAPPPFWRTAILKFVLTAWAISILVTDLIADTWKPRAYYMMYLTHWSLAITILYFLVSLFNTVKGVPEQRPYEDIPSFMVRFAWGLYPTATVAQWTSTILFWILQFQPNQEEVGYKMVMKHGGLAVLVVLEGRFVNRIPVRQKHLLFPVMFSTLYVLWTVLHDLLGLGNPYVEGTDAIYEYLDWNNHLTESIVTSVVLVLGVTPLLFLNTWLLSIWSFPFHFDGLNRHHFYLEEKEKKTSWWESLQMKWKFRGKHEKGKDQKSDSSS